MTMNARQFNDIFTGLTGWYNKRVTETQKDGWFEKLQFMAAEAFRDIASDLMDNSRWMPTVGEVRARYPLWLENNPQAREKLVITPCLECKGTGYLPLQIADLDNLLSSPSCDSTLGIPISVANVYRHCDFRVFGRMALSSKIDFNSCFLSLTRTPFK